MKTRIVTVTLELETDAPLAILRDRRPWQQVLEDAPALKALVWKVRQAQANVIDGSRYPVKPASKSRRENIRAILEETAGGVIISESEILKRLTEGGDATVTPAAVRNHLRALPDYAELTAPAPIGQGVWRWR